MGSISLKNVSKVFGEAAVIPSLDLEINKGEFVVFVGPSGCGKSTLLRLIAGLEDVSGGQIAIDGVDATTLPPAKRGLAMVFQSYALYPHMSVRSNIAFPLKMAGLDKAEIDRKVTEAAKVLNLTDYLDRKPRQLSGGQRQRVAIGRAIVRQPSAFLFDEPLSNLDAALRVNMRLEISELHQQLKATMIYVTHDQVEAMTMADKIVVLNKGRVEQVDSPFGLYANPATLFVADFIGQANVLKGIVREATEKSVTVDLFEKPYTVRALPDSRYQIGSLVSLVVRPESLRLGPVGGDSIAGCVQLRTFVGDRLEYEVTLPDGRMIHVEEPYMTNTPVWNEGDQVGVIVSAPDIVALAD